MTNLAFIKLIVLIAWLASPLAGNVQQSVRSDEGWLDRAPLNWNYRMSGLPNPASSNAADAQTRCRDLVRQPGSSAEYALVNTGWLLYGAVQSYGPTEVVTALSGVDGMCRPLGYQAFVYWEGRYAGTLSPVAMKARTDGALTKIWLLSATRITAEFARYKESDPLCCPTQTSHVTYEVSRDDAPLVALVNIITVPVGLSGENPALEHASGAATTLFGRRWRLIELNGAAVNTTKAYLEFDREAKRFAGNGGCNRIAGSFELDGTNLKFSRAISTRMACLDNEVQQVETNFLKGLEQTTNYQIQGNTLRLWAGGNPILAFKAGG